MMLDKNKFEAQLLLLAKGLFGERNCILIKGIFMLHTLTDIYAYKRVCINLMQSIDPMSGALIHF